MSRGTETFFYSIRRNIGNERFAFSAYSDATTQLFARKASICFAGLRKQALSRNLLSLSKLAKAVDYYSISFQNGTDPRSR